MSVFDRICSVLLLFSFFFITANNADAQGKKVNVGPIPSWVNKLNADTTSTFKESEISLGYLFLLYDDQRNYAEHTTYFHYSEKIVSDDGVQSESDISVSFDPSYQTLIFHEIKVIRNKKVINVLNPGAFKVVQAETERERYIYNGRLSAECTLPDIRKGDIIDYSYSIIGDNPVFKNKYHDDLQIEYGVPVCRIYYRLLMPPDRSVDIKNVATDIKCTKSVNGNEYVWDQTHVSAVLEDDDVPSWFDARGYVQLSEFKSWGEMASWAADIFKYNETVSGKLKEKIEELRKQNPGDKDFLLACIRFVQEEIRYEGIEIGDNTNRPHAPSVVFNQRFGDCKDKSLLLCTMLRTEGFSADPALVNSTCKQVVENWLPSPSDFDHCITKIKLGDKTYWIDPTDDLQKGKLDSLSNPDYKIALVINSATQSLDRIPATYVKRTETTETYVLGDTNTSSTLTVISKFYGDDADNMRGHFQNKSRVDVEKDYVNFYASIYPSITLVDSVVINDDEVNDVITTTEKYKIDSIWEPHGNKIKAEFYAQNLRQQLHIPETRKRKMPYALEYPEDFTQVINITTNTPWNFTDIDFDVKDSCFEFISNSSHSDNNIRLYYHYKSLKDAVAASKVSDYVKKMNSVIDNLNYGLSMTVKKEDNASSDKFPINWMMVFVSLLFSGLCVLIFYNLYKKDFNTVQGASSLPIGGWLVLPAIGLAFTPLRLIFLIYTHPIYFNLEKWTALNNINSGSYNPGLSGMLIGELLTDTFYAIFAIFLLIIFFKKRTTVPRFIMIFYGLSVLIVILDKILVSSVATVNVSNSDVNEIVRSLIAAGIWIPYFLTAQRVKDTFTQTYHQQDNGTTEGLYTNTYTDVTKDFTQP
jgi:hypothetical protein